MADTGVTIVWFRRDLRLEDHAPLVAAVKRGRVIPVFIFSDTADDAAKPLGGASKWWLSHSLRRLDEDLRRFGSRLILRSGSTPEVLEQICSEVNADGLVWHRGYEPRRVALEAQVSQHFEGKLKLLASYSGSLLVEPAELRNQSGKPFKVFTPFWKRCVQGLAPGSPLARPSEWKHPNRWPRSERVDDWGLEPAIPWDEGMKGCWSPGEAGARTQLKSLWGDRLLHYSEDRNRPDRPGTSQLSPHLHFGELSPRQIWAGVARFARQKGIPDPIWKGWQFVSEIGWREFAAYLLYHFPETEDQPLREEFSRFPWDEGRTHLRAWQKGMTGYPIVDAGMRELWHLGWMHNRVRMIVASFLVKHLLIPWQDGADWFWDTLVDADLASNTLGWQWTAGCGADASPYFRIFNPITQGEKFDPEGDYVRRWVPEIASLPNKYLNRPWEAPSSVLESAKVRLGLDYPNPVVDHREARQRALDGYERIRRT